MPQDLPVFYGLQDFEDILYLKIERLQLGLQLKKSPRLNDMLK
jgi:hypothetical protein